MNTKPFSYISIFLFTFLCFSVEAQKSYEKEGTSDSDSIFVWPENTKMALSLSFDDARPSQVDVGIPILDKYDVKATFYVSPGWMQDRIDGWKNAVTNGHEIGNHSMSHPCTGNFDWSRDNALETYTLTDIARELDESNQTIKKLLGVYPESFAYPCGQTFIGRGEGVTSYVPLINRLFESGRGWLDESPNDPVYCDLSQLTGIEADGKSFDEIKILIDKVKESGSWLILAGHEIGEPAHQTTWSKTLDEICKYASDPKNGIWIAPVKEVAKYVNNNKIRANMKKKTATWDDASTNLSRVGDLLGTRDFPHAYISNDLVKMKLFLPDPVNGYYRATRFDWSGIIASLKYKGHEYFGEWKDTQDPMVHEDLSGPVESSNEPGLGYDEAPVGGHFVRIGVGVLEKPEEDGYQWNHTYKIVDHGTWETAIGPDWISFTHTIITDFGYGYVYTKKILLKREEAGFLISHTLKNTGIKPIQIDQYNHNFFVMDGKMTGPEFTVTFPFNPGIIAERGSMEKMNIKGKELTFNDFLSEGHVWVDFSGFSSKLSDHVVKVNNSKTGTGVTFKVDKPLYKMVFWATTTTLCPENFIMIDVKPGKEDVWTSDYTVE